MFILIAATVFATVMLHLLGYATLMCVFGWLSGKAIAQKDRSKKHVFVEFVAYFLLFVASYMQLISTLEGWRQQDVKMAGQVIHVQGRQRQAQLIPGKLKHAEANLDFDFEAIIDSDLEIGESTTSSKATKGPIVGQLNPEPTKYGLNEDSRPYMVWDDVLERLMSFVGSRFLLSLDRARLFANTAFKFLATRRVLRE